MITVRQVKDVFRSPNLYDPEILCEYQPERVVADYFPNDFDREAGHLVILNGRSLTGEECDNFIPVDGSVIVLCYIPGVPAALLFSAATIAAYPTLTAFVASSLTLILLTAVSIGLSYGISAATAPSRPSRGKDDEGPTRNFDGIQNTAGAGLPIPFAYGEVRVGGHFIQSFERASSGSQVQEGITTLYTLLALCVGPIESISDIQINGNPVLAVGSDSAGTISGALDPRAPTIEDLKYDTRLGTIDQAPIDGFYDINIEVLQQKPIQQSEGPLTFFTIREVDAFEVTFRFPNGLLKTSSTAGVRQADVDFVIEYRRTNTVGSLPYSQILKTVSGKTRSPYKSQVRVDGLERGTYEIRITRTTVDDAASQSGIAAKQTTSEVYAITEIQYDEQAHPGIAKIGFKQVPSAQINGAVPTVYTCLIKAFNNVRVYTDVNTYTTKYTDNPAWCCAHYLTEKLHGMGHRYSWSDIDLPDFIRWASYCDEMVPDLKGGLEKRATISMIFDTQFSGDQVLDVFASISGAFLFRRGDKWHVELDVEDEAVWIGTEANIVPGTFKLTFLPTIDRANRIRAIFYDKDRDYQRESAFLELPGLLQGDLFVDANREYLGVSRRSQVHRELIRFLLHNKLDDVQVDLEAGLDALQVAVGRVFGVSVISGGIGIASGKLLAVDATGTALTLDSEVTIETGKKYEIVIQHIQGQKIDRRNIVNPPGVYETIFVDSALWSNPIAVGDNYGVGEFESSIVKFRCSSVSLTDNFRRRIIGSKYDKNVYTFNLDVLPTKFVTSIPDPRIAPPDIENLVLFERAEYAQDGTLYAVIDVDWSSPVSSVIDHFEVYWREAGTSFFEFAGQTKTGHFEITSGVEAPGVTYEICVVSVTSAGVKKNLLSAPRSQITTQGVLVQPPNLTGLSVNIIDGTLIATVVPLSRNDLGPGGYYEWRRGTSWNNSVLLDKTTNPRYESRSYARGTTQILAKAVNSIGRSSPQAVSFTITLYGQLEDNIILTQAEGPSWSGMRQSLVLSGNSLQVNEPSTTWAPGGVSRFGSVGGLKVFPPGFPDPKQQIVLYAAYTTAIINVSSGQVVKARADADVAFTPVYIALGSFDSATFAFDNDKANIPFSGEEADKVRVVIESRVSTTGTAEADFSAWAEHRQRAEYTMKYIQFRASVIIESDAYGCLLDQLTINIDLPDKVLSGTSTAASANPVTVTYPANTFVAVKRLLLSVIGSPGGYTARVTSQSNTAFTWEMYDQANVISTGTIHYEARGY